MLKLQEENLGILCSRILFTTSAHLAEFHMRAALCIENLHPTNVSAECCWLFKILTSQANLAIIKTYFVNLGFLQNEGFALRTKQSIMPKMVNVSLEVTERGEKWR